MNKHRFSRLTGVLYIVGAMIGIMISLAGVIWLWVERGDVVQSVTGTAELAGQTLEATRETIAVIGQSLEQAGADLETIEAMLMNASKTLEDSGGLIRSTGDLVGVDMVDFVGNTQASLASVQNSACMVDNVLGTLNRIPLIGPSLGRGYNPEITLAQSFEDVSTSMDSLPDSLRKIRRDLDVAAANASTLQVEVETLSGQVAEIQTSISNARKVTETYRAILVDLQSRYDGFEDRLPAFLNAVYWGITVIFVWVFIIQVGMLMHGIQLLG